MLIFLLLKVLVVTDIKQDLGYCGSSSGHKAWRNVRFSFQFFCSLYEGKLYVEKRYFSFERVVGELQTVPVVILCEQYAPRFVSG